MSKFCQSTKEQKNTVKVQQLGICNSHPKTVVWEAQLPLKSQNFIKWLARYVLLCVHFVFDSTYNWSLSAFIQLFREFTDPLSNFVSFVRDQFQHRPLEFLGGCSCLCLETLISVTTRVANSLHHHTTHTLHISLASYVAASKLHSATDISFGNAGHRRCLRRDIKALIIKALIIHWCKRITGMCCQVKGHFGDFVLHWQYMYMWLHVQL